MRLSVLLCFSSIPPHNLSILSENFLVSFCSNTDNLSSADWKVVPVKEKLQNNPHLRAQTCGEHIPLAMEEQHKAMKQHKTKKIQISAGTFCIPDTIETFNFSKTSAKVLKTLEQQTAQR